MRTTLLGTYYFAFPLAYDALWFLSTEFPHLMDCQKEINDSISNISYEKTRRVYENEVLEGTTSKDFRRLEDLLKQQLPNTDHQIEGLGESEYQCIFH